MTVQRKSTMIKKIAAVIWGALIVLFIQRSITSSMFWLAGLIIAVPSFIECITKLTRLPKGTEVESHE